MRNENGPSGPLEFLIGLIVVGALATGTAWDHIQLSLGKIMTVVTYYLFIVVKYSAVAAGLYGLWLLSEWWFKFLERIDRIEIDVIGLRAKEITELDDKIHQVRQTTWGIESEVGDVRQRVDKLEEEAKRGKDNSAPIIAAVVSEITGEKK